MEPQKNRDDLMKITDSFNQNDLLFILLLIAKSLILKKIKKRRKKRSPFFWRAQTSWTCSSSSYGGGIKSARITNRYLISCHNTSNTFTDVEAEASVQFRFPVPAEGLSFSTEISPEHLFITSECC
ncbi:hypothetical protein ILYODFUR_034607 [Ilyodon furcidens]|uniref:Uncharacterized protein n=1 Tax=Ilyodon furcidens TaxID=33524 RepID=A0ABV0TDK9_9TELE